MPKYALAPRVRLREDKVRGGWVLLMAEQAVMLSETAVEILQLCHEASDQEILSTLQGRYPGEELEGDVREFLQEAVQEKWLRLVD
jgi:pyrroloquinoline quinone biosynthesis protein D